ncbi:MAG: hypothetical protein HQ526_00290 [Actinobacteria bacterium]|nr:hypothetical protein [Actinomycetota bacterium]
MSTRNRRAIATTIGTAAVLMAFVAPASAVGAANDAAQSDPLGGSSYGVNIVNTTGNPMQVAFTTNSESANGYTAPHCVYAAGEKQSATTLPEQLTIPGGATVNAGELEQRASNNCSNQQAYLGITVTEGGQTYYAMMQTSGPSGGTFYKWVSGNPKAPTPKGGINAVDAKSPVHFTSSYDSGSGYTVEVLDDNQPVPITDHDEAQRLIDKYCSTQDDTQRYCDLKKVKLTPIQSELALASDLINNPAGNPEVVHTRQVTKSYTYSNAITVGSEVEWKGTVNWFVASAEFRTMLKAEYQHTWGTSYEVSQSLTVPVPAGKTSAIYASNGKVEAKGDFVITIPDQNNKKVVVKDFTADIPLVQNKAVGDVDYYPVILKVVQWDSATSNTDPSTPPANAEVTATYTINSNGQTVKI